MFGPIGLPEILSILAIVGPGILILALAGPRWYRRWWLIHLERHSPGGLDLSVRPLIWPPRVTWFLTTAVLFLTKGSVRSGSACVDK
jgi:hypothetical protein